MISVDIGTTSTKTVLFRETSAIIQQANYGYDSVTPSVYITVQDTEKLIEAVLGSIAEVMHLSNIDSKDVSFISFSSAMHSVIAVGEDNEPLTACITWADNRSHAWTEKLQYDGHGHHIYSKTGTPIH